MRKSLKYRLRCVLFCIPFWIIGLSIVFGWMEWDYQKSVEKQRQLSEQLAKDYGVKADNSLSEERKFNFSDFPEFVRPVMENIQQSIGFRWTEILFAVSGGILCAVISGWKIGGALYSELERQGKV